MKKITRRKAIGLIGGTTALTAFSLSGCCAIRQILKVPCEPGIVWEKDKSLWWEARKKKRITERKKDIESGKRTGIELPKPFLMVQPFYPIPMEAGQHGYIGDQLIQNFHFNDWNEFFLLIKNAGNAPSWNCIVEAYETPFSNYGKRFTDFTLTDRVMVTIMPWESKEVKLKFKVTRASMGGLLTRCYDPFCDPGILVCDQYERHNNGTGWVKWNGL